MRQCLCCIFCLTLGIASMCVVAAQPLQLNYLNPESYLVDTISVEGAESISPQVLISVSGLKVGDVIQIPGSQLADAIRNIWKQGIVNHVDIQAARRGDDRILAYF